MPWINFHLGERKKKGQKTPPWFTCGARGAGRGRRIRLLSGAGGRWQVAVSSRESGTPHKYWMLCPWGQQDPKELCDHQTPHRAHTELTAKASSCQQPFRMIKFIQHHKILPSTEFWGMTLLSLPTSWGCSSIETSGEKEGESEGGSPPHWQYWRGANHTVMATHLRGRTSRVLKG